MFDVLFDRLAIGVALLDGANRVVGANRYARRIFETGDGLMLRDGRLAAERRREDHRLQAVISGADPWRAAVIARGADAKPLSVIVAAVAHGEVASDAPEQVSRILLLGDSERHCEVPQAILRWLYGLTHREAMVTCLLLAGGRLPEAAVQLGITTGTARNYLKQIFAKTDTKSQAELVSLLIRQVGWLDYSQTPATEAGRKLTGHGNSGTAERRSTTRMPTPAAGPTENTQGRDAQRITAGRGKRGSNGASAKQRRR